MAEAIASPRERIVITNPDETIALKQLIPDDDVPYRDLIAYDEDHLRQFDDVTADKYPDAQSVRKSIEHPSNPDKLRFSIWEGEGMVGIINMTPEEAGVAEMGWLIGKEYIGHGYAARAAKLLVDYGFNMLGLHKQYCEIVVGNYASRRTAENAGFELVAEYPNDHDSSSWRLEITKDSTRTN